MKNKILPFTYFVFLLGILLTASISPINSFGQNKSTSIMDIDWVELGPNNFGGETKAILFDNRDPQGLTLFAGSAYGGLYISNNVGQTWNLVGSATTTLNVSSMTQTATGTIYVGTGNADTSDIGSGLYKSDDGVTFTVIPSTVPNFVSTDWWYINDVAVDEANGIIYVASDMGIKYSLDNGGTWAVAKIGDSLEITNNCSNFALSAGNVLYADMSPRAVMCGGNPAMFSTIDSLPENVGRYQFATAPSNANVVYASVITPLGALDNFYRSNDGGLNWYIIAPGGSTAVNFYGQGDNISQGVGLKNNVIEVDPADADKILVGGINMWEGRRIDSLGFFQWEEISQSIANSPLFPTYVSPNHLCYQFRPGHSNEAILGTEGGVFLGIFSSATNAYEPKYKNYYSTWFNTLDMSGEKTRVIGGTKENATILIDGTGNPVTAQYGAAVWQNALGFGVVSKAGYCQNSIIDPEIALYSLTNDQFRRTEDLGFSFASTFLTGDINTSIEGIQFPPTLLWENFDDMYSPDSINFKAEKDYVAGEDVIIRSLNRGYPFHATIPADLQSGDSVMLQDVVSTKYFIGGEDEVWMTRDVLKFGAQPEWFLITNSEEGGFEGKSHSIAISKDANYCWTGTEEGKLYRMSNISPAYDYDRADIRSPFCIISTTEVPVYYAGTTNPIDAPISAISIDPNDPARLIITINWYNQQQIVMRCTDGLAQNPTFVNISSNLPTIPAHSCLIEMSNPEIAFVGTQKGIYMTEDLSAAAPTWYMPNDPNGFSIGHTGVSSLKQQLVAKTPISYTYWNGIDTVTDVFAGTNNYGVIYAGTYGRGAFMCDQFEKPVGIDDLDGTSTSFENEILIYPNPVSTSATIEYKAEKAGEIQIHVMDLNGKVVKSLNFNSQKEGIIKTNMNMSDLPSGTYIMHLISGSKSAVSKFIVVK